MGNDFSSPPGFVNKICKHTHGRDLWGVKMVACNRRDAKTGCEGGAEAVCLSRTKSYHGPGWGFAGRLQRSGISNASYHFGRVVRTEGSIGYECSVWQQTAQAADLRGVRYHEMEAVFLTI